MDRPIMFYVAGPFRAATQWLQEQNIRRAEIVAYRIWEQGHFALCPHSNARWAHDAVPDAAWLAGTMEMMRRCDVVVVLAGWKTSVGTCCEIREAKRLGMRLLYLNAYRNTSEMIDAACRAMAA